MDSKSADAIWGDEDELVFMSRDRKIREERLTNVSIFMIAE